MTNSQIDQFAQHAADIVMRSGIEFIAANHADLVPQMTADDSMVVALREAVRGSLDSALADAREAMECGMTKVAEATFSASLRLAGIEAAKSWADARE